MLAKGGRCSVGYGPGEKTVDLATIPPEVTALHYFEVFHAERDRLEEIVEIVRDL